MSASSPSLGQVLGHYRILQQIGSGGMGVVYRARDERLQRDVALKVLPAGLLQEETARKRFRNEALTLSRFNHPNVAQVYDFDTQDGIDFLVMEYVQGLTLASALKSGSVPEDRIRALGCEIAGALADAHAGGVIHCDVKPANIMLTQKGQIKLLDFGLAQLLRIDATEPTLSIASASDGAGTLPYMAPELLRGGRCDERSDVYAIGVTLYEMTTGRRPFESPVSTALVETILHGVPDPPRKTRPELSQSLQQVILRCLEKQPERRFQSAGEVRDALSGRVQETRLGAGRRLIGVAVGCLLAIAVLGIGFFLLRHWKQISQREPAIRELAIVPASVLNSGTETAAFGIGLIQRLESRLAQLSSKHHLQIIPASEMRAKNISTVQQANQVFGANLGIELSVERAGDMMRVNYVLIDAARHQPLNGDTITAKADDPFSLEDQVAASVVRELELELQPEEQSALAAHGTDKPAAYDYYLQGLGYLRDFSKLENVNSAIEEFNHAVELDSRYGLAFAGLGEAYYRKYRLTQQVELMSPARQACERAVVLLRGQAAGHLCLGIVDSGTGQLEEAASELKTAIGIEPNDDRTYRELAAVFGKLGRPKDAEQLYRQAIALRPNDWMTYNWLGEFYSQTGRYPEAAEMFSQVTALSPDNYVGYTNLGGAYVNSGDYGRAVPLLERSVKLRATGENTSNLATAYFQLHDYTKAARTYEAAVQLDAQNYELWGNLGDAYYFAPGERARAQAAYVKAIELAKQQIDVNPRNPTLLSYTAQYYAMNGQKADALRYLKKSLELGTPGPDLLTTAAIIYNQVGEQNKAMDYLEQAVKAGVSPSTLRDTPNFDNLRAFPRYQKLLGPG